MVTKFFESTFMPIMFSMSVAVLLWSLYPLAAAFGMEDMSNWDIILFILLFSTLGSLIISIVSLIITKKTKDFIHIQKNMPLNGYITMLISGISGFTIHVFFIWALDTANKGGVALLLEAWPAIAIIITPYLMKKKWKPLTLKEFGVSMIALLGVAVIVFSDKDVSLNFFDQSLDSDFDYKVLIGYIMAFAGAYLAAFMIVLQAALSEYYQGLKNDFTACILNQTLSRGISFICALATYFIIGEQFNIENISWIPLLVIGFGIMSLGTTLHIYTLLKSNRVTVHILYYFVPVFAVIWLWLAGQTNINAGLIVGGTIITLSNIYLAYLAHDKKL